jgi:hypothetical protein
MEKPSKRKRPASGWPKGWEVIGGDVVDYEAALDFDAVILGRTPMTGEYHHHCRARCASANHPIANWDDDGGTATCSCGDRSMRITKEDARRFNAMSAFMWANAPPIDEAALSDAIATASKASSSPPGSPAQSAAEGLPRQGRQAAPAEAHQAHSEADPLDP